MINFDYNPECDDIIEFSIINIINMREFKFPIIRSFLFRSAKLLRNSTHELNILVTSKKNSHPQSQHRHLSLYASFTFFFFSLYFSFSPLFFNKRKKCILVFLVVLLFVRVLLHANLFVPIFIILKIQKAKYECNIFLFHENSVLKDALLLKI